jgi:hypothetical protein
MRHQNPLESTRNVEPYCLIFGVSLVNTGAGNFNKLRFLPPFYYLLLAYML